MLFRSLGFAKPTDDSLDSVSDRDFALDYLMAATQCSLHLSRLAEEFIIWASQPFGFVKLPDAYSTGSSIMPQRSEEHTSELQSLMRISSAVFCLKKKTFRIIRRR